MYGGRALGIFTMCLAAVMVGAAYNALDEYEAQMEARSTTMPPIVPRKLDPDFQRYFGAAWAKTATAEAALRDCAEQHMALCRRQAEEGVPFTYRDDVLLGLHRPRGDGADLGDGAERSDPHRSGPAWSRRASGSSASTATCRSATPTATPRCATGPTASSRSRSSASPDSWPGSGAHRTCGRGRERHRRSSTRSG